MVAVVTNQAGRENLRIRVLESLNSDLTAFVEARKISKQDVIDGVLRWFLSQEPLLQLMILDVIPKVDQREIARMVLVRLDETNGARLPKKYRSIFPTEQASHPQPDDPPREQPDKTPRAPASRSTK